MAEADLLVLALCLDSLGVRAESSLGGPCSKVFSVHVFHNIIAAIRVEFFSSSFSETSE